MSISVDGIGLGTEKAAEIIEVNVDTLNTWRRRNGFLPWKQTGRGNPVNWTLQDLLRASVAKKLIANRFPASTACQYASSGGGFLHDFINGTEVRVAIRDGQIVRVGDPDRDLFLTFSLEVDGWKIVSGILDAIADEFSLEDAEAAKAEFEAAVAKQRGC